MAESHSELDSRGHSAACLRSPLIDPYQPSRKVRHMARPIRVKVWLFLQVGEYRFEFAIGGSKPGATFGKQFCGAASK